MATLPNPPGSPDEVIEALAAHDYVADRDLGTSVFLSLSLERPLLLEGEAGVGKTELARTWAAALGTKLIHETGSELERAPVLSDVLTQHEYAVVPFHLLPEALA